MGDERKFDILEDGIMPPIISSLVQGVLAVREYVMNRAGGSVTERTRGRLLVAPQLEHVWRSHRVDQRVEHKRYHLWPRAVDEVVPAEVETTYSVFESSPVSLAR